MNVILFGSPLNPLSAVAASYFKENHKLMLIVLPKNVRIDLKGGLLYFCSQICVGLFRYFHIFLRLSGLKRSGTYSCMREFIKDNPSIPTIYCPSGSQDLERRICSIVGDVGVDEYIVFSCIFP